MPKRNRPETVRIKIVGDARPEPTVVRMVVVDDSSGRAKPAAPAQKPRRSKSPKR